MIYNYSLNYVLNHYKINTSKKNLIFNIRYTKKNYQIIKIFKTLGIIRRFFLFKTLNNNLKIKIYIFYFKHIPTYKYIKILSTPTKSFSISYNSLKYLKTYTSSSFYLLETSYGIITHIDALNRKIGGKLFAFITI